MSDQNLNEGYVKNGCEENKAKESIEWRQNTHIMWWYFFEVISMSHNIIFLNAIRAAINHGVKPT